MTDRNAILAALTNAIRDAIDNVHDMDVTHADYARASAAAVLELVGPRRLVWDKHPDDDEWYTVTDEDRIGEPEYMVLPRRHGFAVFHGFGGRKRMIENRESSAEAQAAAQAHADAAHWANTKIGGR